MKLLATSGPCKGGLFGRVFEIDLETKTTREISCVSSKQNLKAGTIRHKSGWVFVVENIISEDKNRFNVDETLSAKSSLLFLDNNFSFQREVIFPKEFELHFSHQVVLHEDKIYITDTGHDRIVHYDLNTETWGQLQITQEMQDTRHVNSLFFKEDLMYVMCHNRGNSAIQIYKKGNFISEIKNTGIHSHNIWEMNDDIWFCDSGRGLLKSLSGRFLRAGPYPRGVLLTEDLLLVAASINYKTPLEIPEETGFGDLYIFDKNTLLQKERFSLEPLHMIMDIVLV